jgi:dTDP-4-amino-4,6-dideoxygalactose transaminase
VNAGAIPVFADVDSDSQNISKETIVSKITDRTRAILCVHLAGWPCDMDPIIELASKFNLKVIEDCAQAHGALYKGRSVGSIGDVGCWSFCQDKIISTGGEGGMVTTNQEDIWEKIWSFKDHGKSWEAVYESSHPPGYRWLHESFGSNYRMTELQAVVGRIQLRRMPSWHEVRLKNAHHIWEAASSCSSLRVPLVPEYIEHAAYKCYVFVENGKRDLYMAEINKRGVPCFSGSCSEVYLERAFDGTGYRPQERLPVAKKLGETSLVFLCHPTLLSAEIEKTCSVIKTVCG